MTVETPQNTPNHSRTHSKHLKTLLEYHKPDILAIQHINLIINNLKPLQKDPKPRQRNCLNVQNLHHFKTPQTSSSIPQTSPNHTQTTLNTHINLLRKIPDTFNIQRLHAYTYMGFIRAFSRQTHMLCVYPYWPPI